MKKRKLPLIPVWWYASRWPWQKVGRRWGAKSSDTLYGWHPLCPHLILGRFGGGWNFNLGIQIGRGSAILNIGLGSLVFTTKAPDNA